MKRKQLVEYIPPQKGELMQFARQVCQRMGIPDEDRETVRGLAEFLEVACRIKAKQLSSQGVEDEPQTT
jgi:hypothetical protein